MDLLDKYKNLLAEKGEVYVRVKARPGAPVTSIRAVLIGEEETIKIDIAAVPEKGKANIELIDFLSTEFKVPKYKVAVISGAGEKVKLIKIIR